MPLVLGRVAKLMHVQLSMVLVIRAIFADVNAIAQRQSCRVRADQIHEPRREGQHGMIRGLNRIHDHDVNLLRGCYASSTCIILLVECQDLASYNDQGFLLSNPTTGPRNVGPEEEVDKESHTPICTIYRNLVPQLGQS